MSHNSTLESKSKIICLVVNDLATDQRMQRICSALSQAGYDVTLVGRELPNSPPLQPHRFRQYRLKCFWNKGFLFYMEYNIRLAIWLMSQKFDIVNAIDLDTILPAWLTSKLKSKKITYDAHEWFPYCPEIVVRPAIHWFWKSVEKFSVPKMNATYTVSQSIADELAKTYHVPIGLVRNMPIYQKIDNTSTELYILYQGALNVGRGLPELINVMQDIHLPLYIAGDGDIKQEVIQQVIDLNMESKVKFLGRLTPDKLQEVTKNAFIGVNLLENLGRNYYYSLANKFFDYVQAEVPQISMNFPEYKKMNQEFEVAVLIPNLGKEVLSEAILRLVEDNQLYAHLKAQSKKAKRKWNWEEEEKNLLSIYEQL